ncbi:MAG: DNA methylase [Bacteroidales bacterium]|nr:DNA methylase [Bacteroidales bacterium]
MDNDNRTYIAIDLKSFYASVECVERGLDPLTTNLVVADVSRTEKTICLAVSPSLKSYGISGRARLFEVVQRLRDVNAERRRNTPGFKLLGKSSSDVELKKHPDWEIDYIAAVPRMAYYIEYSTRIYSIYLKYVSEEDIFAYSIDEVFIDATDYLKRNGMTAHEMAMKMIRHVLAETGITATAGIGTNLYLSKIAMDIVAKHIAADSDGVRIAELDEMTYRQKLWNHRPLTSFWRVGGGIARKLASYGIDTMGKIARCSIEHEELLYKLFGVNAELLIDHAWGWEPCTMEMVKAYRPETNSISSGQVLTEPYTCAKARIVAREMADALALDLVDKNVVCDQLVLTIGYDVESLSNPAIAALYDGPITVDHYGRRIPKHAHGSSRLGRQTSSSRLIVDAVMAIFDKTVNENLLVRRLNLTANNVIPAHKVERRNGPVQLDLFTDYETLERQRLEEEQFFEKEHRMQKALLSIKKKYGKNAILKGTSYEDGATAMERNRQIGGHKA